MAFPMADEQQILVVKRTFSSSYSMPSMEMATDHYNIGYLISGDRRTITPLQTYCYHAGDVSMMPPYLYHRTISESTASYESYLIKFTPQFIQPFIDHMGHHILDELYEQKICHFNQASQEKILKMFAEMEEEYHKEKPYKEFILQGMLFRLLATVWEERILTKTDTANQSPLTKPVIDAICHIETYYASNLTLEKTARAVNLSPAYLSRLFHAQLGMTFSAYLNNVKMRHVKILLSQTDKSIMEIAFETGFCSGEYLSAQFKTHTGLTPTQFRQISQTDILDLQK